MEGYLFLTHTSRSFDFDQCSAHAFHQRYGKSTRLKNLPAFNSLPKIDNTGYRGSLSLFRISDIDNKFNIQHLGNIQSNEKIQHVHMLNNNSCVMVTDCMIEIWEFINSIEKLTIFDHSCYSVKKRFSHPHYAGGHTASPINEKLIALSASASDSVLIFDIETQRLHSRYRMPDEIYGTNYNLTDEMNVSTHYIHNDLQTTHINSASVNKASSKVVVSALIPGSIGEFNLKTGGYEELAHGFRGCHGARYHDEDYIYFTDSNQGALYTIDEMKKTNRVFSVDSKWLHDVEHIYNDVFVFATSDKNSIMFINIVTGDVIDNIQFKTCDAAQTDINFSPPTDWFGNTVQFFHFWKLEDPSDFHKNVSRMPA